MKWLAHMCRNGSSVIEWVYCPEATRKHLYK